MATTKKKSTKKQTAKQKEQQNRRELFAILCILLAVFALLCCFDTDAFLIYPCACLIGGLFGQVGRYALPILLCYMGILLFSSRGKPVKLRMIASVTVVLALSSVVHLFALVLSGSEASLKLSTLYFGGMDWSTGGVLPGFISGLLSMALTEIGALIVVLLLMLLSLIYSIGMSINGEGGPPRGETGTEGNKGRASGQSYCGKASRTQIEKGWRFRDRYSGR